MPTFVVPDSAGTRRLREFNPCHKPPGPGGGQFARKEDCGGTGPAPIGAPRDRDLSGEQRANLIAVLRGDAKRIRTLLKGDPSDIDERTDKELITFLQSLGPDLTAAGIQNTFGIDLLTATQIRDAAQLYQRGIERLQAGEGAYSEPEPSDFKGSGAEIREKLLKTDEKLTAKIKATEQESDRLGEEMSRLTDEMQHFSTQIREAHSGGPDLVLMRYPLGSLVAGAPIETGIPGRKEPLDDGASIKAWLEDPLISEDERAVRQAYLMQYERAAKERQELWANAQAVVHDLQKQRDTYDKKVRKVLTLPKADRAPVFGTVVGDVNNRGSATVVREQAKNLKAARDFVSAISRRNIVNLPFTMAIRKKADDERAHAISSAQNYPKGVIAIDSKTSASVIAHEITHHIEFNSPEIMQASMDFRDARTGGERFERLVDLLPTHNYKPDEEVRAGSMRAFHTPYVGKVYMHYGGAEPSAVNFRGQRESATEVLTMGVQYLYENPAEFARRDPDYFDWTVDVLRHGPKVAMRKIKTRIPTATSTYGNMGDRVSW